MSRPRDFVPLPPAERASGRDPIDLPDDAERALAALRQAAPPDVVFGRIHREQLLIRGQRHQRRQRAIRYGVPAVAAAIAIGAWLGTQENALPAEVRTVARVEGVLGANHEGVALAAGQEIPAGRIEIRENGALAMTMGRPGAALRGDLDVRGPAAMELRSDRVILASGSARLRGRIPVEGCGCNAVVDGEAEVETHETVEPQFMRFVVLAGEVVAPAPTVHCRIVDLAMPEPPETGDGADHAVAPTAEIDDDGDPRGDAIAAPESGRPAAGVTRHGARRPVATTGRGGCDLAAQAQAYRSAIVMRGHDDRALLDDLRDVRRRFPRCPLSHEVDLAIIEGLLRTGQGENARREASRFLRRYPQSARREDIARIVAD